MSGLLAPLLSASSASKALVQVLVALATLSLRWCRGERGRGFGGGGEAHVGLASVGIRVGGQCAT
jgi:hypothetical protein